MGSVVSRDPVDPPTSAGRSRPSVVRMPVVVISEMGSVMSSTCSCCTGRSPDPVVAQASSFGERGETRTPSFQNSASVGDLTQPRRIASMTRMKSLLSLTE